MGNCRRCGRDTDRRTLNGESLCGECAEWYEDHVESREIGQHALTDWEDDHE